MQDLKALEGKSLVELREIAKASGIGDTTVKKRELIEKIAGVSASEGAPAENKEKRGRGRKKEVPATEMQQTAAIAEPAAVKAEAAPETVPQAPRGRRPRITNTKTENTAPAQRPPITVAGPPAEPELPMESVPAPAPAEACEAMQARVRKELESVKDVRIETTPEVAVDKLFDAIVAPYKGKVVFVDFWNTWCGPCRASIKANEPLKSGELKSDDLVWIYIANETSPLVAYKTSIAKIAGKHYRLDDAQWKYLCEKFQIDGIPSYVLVDRDGSYELRNDFRDHDLMKKTLKGMLE